MGLPPEFPMPDDEDDPDDSPLFPGDSAKVEKKSTANLARHIKRNRTSNDNRSGLGAWKEPTADQDTEYSSCTLCRPNPST